MQQDTTVEHSERFPHVGFRARRWQRFERDLHAWLRTPQGGFVRWCAQQQVAGAPAAPEPS